MQRFHPALELRRHHRHGRFIIINRAHRADGLAQRAAPDFRRAQVHILRRGRIHRDVRRISIRARRVQRLVHWSQLHAANRTVAGMILNHLRMHAARVKCLGLIGTGIGTKPEHRRQGYNQGKKCFHISEQVLKFQCGHSAAVHSWVAHRRPPIAARRGPARGWFARQFHRVEN